ncbi:hypothetical protein [Microcystis viridis]|uniref:hypothetical protein n=1 Tax=Microcystis viridis TaxID=44822 RepID=UPI0016893135|nr:hypothetical protein [Microcystis viridis]
MGIWAHAMRPYGFLGEFGFFGVFWGYLGARDAPLRVFGGIWVIWAHAMRPYGFWGEFGFFGGIWVIWAHAMRPYGVLDAAEGEKPPHQVNLDTFREKIFLYRESLK